MFSFILMLFMVVVSKKSISVTKNVEINSSSININSKKLKNMTTSKKAYQMQKKKRENLFERNKELTEIQIQLLCDNSRLNRRIQDLKQSVKEMIHFCRDSGSKDILWHSAEFTEPMQAATEKSVKHMRMPETSDNRTNISSDHLKNEMMLTYHKDATSVGEVSSGTVDEFEKISELQKDSQSMETGQSQHVIRKQQYNADVGLPKCEIFMKNIHIYNGTDVIIFENDLLKKKIQIKKLKEGQQNQQQHVQIHYCRPTDSSMHGEYREEEYNFVELINIHGDQCSPHSGLLNGNCEMITLLKDNVTPGNLSSQDSCSSLEDKSSIYLSTQDDRNLKNDCVLNVVMDESTLTLGATEEVMDGISDEGEFQEEKSSIKTKNGKPLKFKAGLVKRYQEREMSVCNVSVGDDFREKTGEVFVPQTLKCIKV